MQEHDCSEVEDLELVSVPLGAVVSGFEQTCSRVYVDKTIHDLYIMQNLV